RVPRIPVRRGGALRLAEELPGAGGGGSAGDEGAGVLRAEDARVARGAGGRAGAGAGGGGRVGLAVGAGGRGGARPVEAGSAATGCGGEDPGGAPGGGVAEEHRAMKLRRTANPHARI